MNLRHHANANLGPQCVHAATSACERGDPLQTVDRGRNLDFALGW